MNNRDLDLFLKKILLLEQALPKADIRSRLYFHGQLNRQTTEDKLRQNGQFLVRESSSQDNQYVLSCFQESECLHFIIHEHVQLANNCRVVQYAFEEELFLSIAELIDHHLQAQSPITKASNATITTPVHRNLPLNHLKLSEYFQQNATLSVDDLLKGIDPTTLLPIIQIDQPPINKEECSSDTNNSYLQQVLSGVSAIKLEKFCPKILSSCMEIYNDEQNSENICKIIARTGPGIMASHLFKRDLKFIGLDFDSEMGKRDDIFQSGIELIFLSLGRQMRRDIIIRHECLKYFVILTILKAKCLETQEMILQKWIKIATKLMNSFGDYFGFGAVMAGLCHQKITTMRWLWSELRVKHTNQAFVFETKLKSHYLNLLKTEEPILENTTFPFVIQLCHLIESNYILNSKLFPLFAKMDLETIITTEREHHQKIGLNDFSLDDVMQHTNLSTKIMENLSLFESNTRKAFGGFFFKENLLDELFKTEFHLQFLFENQCDVDKINHEQFRKLEEKIDKIFIDEYQ